jgi:16S rRNA (guanine966-N2)-methyltransferase
MRVKSKNLLGGGANAASVVASRGDAKVVKPKTASEKPGRKAGSQEVRIIGGQWRRSKLPVLDMPGLRPTPDRVRETLFNWLGQDLTGWQVLDAFAGTGALGMEAASRGAQSVLLIEQDDKAARQLEANAQRLKAEQVKVRKGDAIALMNQLPAASVDLIFLDPPYAANLFEKAIKSATRLLKSGGVIYLEADRALEPQWLEGTELSLHRQLKAGAVHAHLLLLSASRNV